MSAVSRPPDQPSWGIAFPRPAATGSGLQLVTAPVPEILTLALNQHVGTVAQPLVTAGTRVAKGEPVAATAADRLGARIHSPTSGKVLELTHIDTPGRGRTQALRIEADGDDRPWSGYTPVPNPHELTPINLRAAIIESGIVGLGGAMFPAGIKLNPGSGIETLILNGVECEPQMNCDDALMRQHPHQVLLGAQIMLRILEADVCLVAIKEARGPDAASPAHLALSAALAELDDDRIKIVEVPSLYPVGGEAQLIQLLTGREIPSGGLPWDTGVACQNVGTAAAITQFFAQGEPLISRVVTVTGGGVHQPVNVIARLGTPIADLVACAGGYTDSASRLILGGPMMGIAAADDSLPVSKATNCVYVAGAEELGVLAPELPCIRCSECAVACPVSLSPQLLLQAQRGTDFDNLESLGIMDCIECGCCDYVCPSKIPLTRGFRQSKRDVWQARRERRQARRAEQRFAARTERLNQQAEEEAALLDAPLSGFGTSPDEQALAELKQRIQTGRPAAPTTEDD